MPSNKKRFNPLKDSSDIFAEETTSAEKIMDGFTTSSPSFSFNEDDFQDLPKLAEKVKQTNPNYDPQQDETEILALLDKYYNGDRDVTVENRYKYKEVYKQQLIEKFRHWGLVYVEKKHYSLSRNEKHLIRMDFYGTVNKPRNDQTSKQYQKNKSDLPPLMSRKQKKHAAKDNKNATQDNIINFSPTNTKYDLSDYDLDLSPTWRLMRTFPRFHVLENKVRLQMQKQKLNPEIIPYLNVYDYSDIFYNYFKSDNTKDGDSVTIFLGARQSFVKDVFRKQENWLRDYFKRQNYDDRYIEALIKSAQGRGVTCNLELKNTSQDYIYDYIKTQNKKFTDFVRAQALNGNHIQNIMEQLDANGKPLTEEMRNFIAYNETSFRNHFKRKHISARFINSIFELLSEKEFPSYLKENLKSFVISNEGAYRNYLLKSGSGESELKTTINRIKSKPANNLDCNTIASFARQNPQLFRNYLQKENRDENYIKFAFNMLTPPLAPEYVLESLQNFLLSRPKAPKQDESLDNKLLQDVYTSGITKDNFTEVKRYILKYRREYNEFFKKNNILTYQELNEQYTDVTGFIVKTQGIPLYAKGNAKDFISNHQDVFRYWYANFQLHQHQDTAKKHYQRIINDGLHAEDFTFVSKFINQRLQAFGDFCRNKGLNLENNTINEILQNGDFFEKSSSVKPETSERINSLKAATAEFIRNNSYIYRQSIVQQRVNEKEKEADLILKKISRQGITASMSPIAHKFILNNKNLFSNDFYNSKEDKQYAASTLSSVLRGTANLEMQNQAKMFINQNKNSFIGFINDAKNVEKYINNTLQTLETGKLNPDSAYWSMKFIVQNEEDFETYLQNEKIDSENLQKFKQGIQKFKLSENIQMSFDKNGINLHFSNDAAINIKNISVHHKCAVQDSFSQMTAEDFANDNLTKTFQPFASPQPNETGMINLAAANYFNNLCLIIDDPYHIQFFHGMDSTEKFDNCERYIARIYPADPNLIFFGGLASQDQLSYDYSNDQRTARYRKHTEKMAYENQKADKSEPLSPEMAFFIVTGSRQGRR